MNQNNPRFIVIHTSAVSRVKLPNQCDAINRYHQSMGFPKSSLGFFVGYHRLSSNGTEYVCRNDDDVGAHTNNIVDGLSLNFQSLGYCMAFDGDTEQPDPRDIENMKKTVLEWMAKYAIPIDRVRYHRHYNTLKTCPGSLISDDMVGVWFGTPGIPDSAPLPPISEQERMKILQLILSLYQHVFALLVRLNLKRVSFDSEEDQTA